MSMLFGWAMYRHIMNDAHDAVGLEKKYVDYVRATSSNGHLLDFLTKFEEKELRCDTEIQRYKEIREDIVRQYHTGRLFIHSALEVEFSPVITKGFFARWSFSHWVRRLHNRLSWLAGLSYIHPMLWPKELANEAVVIETKLRLGGSFSTDLILPLNRLWHLLAEYSYTADRKTLLINLRELLREI